MTNGSFDGGQKPCETLWAVEGGRTDSDANRPAIVRRRTWLTLLEMAAHPVPRLLFGTSQV